MELREIITALEDATQTLPGQIDADTDLVSVSGWDSMGVVSFVELMGEACRIELQAEAVAQCRTPRALHALLTMHLAPTSTADEIR